MNQQVEASVGTPVLDIELVKYPNLKWFPGLQYKGNKKDFIEALYQGPQPVLDDLTKWTIQSTGVPAVALSHWESAGVFAEVYELGATNTVKAMQYLSSFQEKKLRSQQVFHKTPNGRVGSVVEELLNVAWESDTDDDDYEDQLFIAESSEDEDEDEDEERLALEADSDMSDAGSAMDVDEPAMDVDEPDNSTMLSYLESLTTESAFHTFCLMVPDKDHAALWRKTFSTHPHWWELLCVFWEAQLRYAFFPGPNDTMIDGEDAFQRAVLVLRQMRMVHTQSSAWVDEVKKTKLGPTICDISDTATLINGLNPHADDLFLKLRAQDSLCQVLDKWVKEADSWVCTPIVFTPHPKPNARKLDPENPGKALFNIITSSRMEKLIPRQKLPDSIQLFVAESNFSHAWHHWLAISLEAYKFDVSGVDVHRLYSLFMDYIIKNPASVKRVADDTLRKILTRTVQVREMQEKARVWANAGQPIKWAKTKEAKLEQQQQWKAHGLTDEIVKSFPATACVNCFRLAEEHHCRQRIYVTEQDVEFLRGCGITMAPLQGMCPAHI